MALDGWKDGVGAGNCVGGMASAGKEAVAMAVAIAVGWEREKCVGGMASAGKGGVASDGESFAARGSMDEG